MTAAARADVPLCTCGHIRERHNDEMGCDFRACGCAGYRSRDALRAVEQATASGELAAAVKQLVGAGRRSHHQRTRTLAERVYVAVRELQQALDAESADARRALQRQVDDLEVRLREARAALANVPPQSAL